MCQFFGAVASKRHDARSAINTTQAVRRSVVDEELSACVVLIVPEGTSHAFGMLSSPIPKSPSHPNQLAH